MTLRTLSLGLALGALVLTAGCHSSRSYRQSYSQPAIVQSCPIPATVAAPCPPPVAVAPACPAPACPPPPAPPAFGR